MADVFLGCKLLYNWPAVGWIEGEVVKRNVDRRMKIGSAHANGRLTHTSGCDKERVDHQKETDSHRHTLLQ